MSRGWIFQTLVAAAGFAIMSLFLKAATFYRTPAQVLFYLFIFVTSFCFVHLLFQKTLSVPAKGTIIPLIGAAFFSVVANALAVSAYVTAPNLGYVDAISYLRAVITTVAAVFIFNAKLSTKGILGVILAVVGAILISF